MPVAVAIVLVAGAAGPLVSRLGIKPVLLAGLTVFAGALLWLAALPTQGSFTGHLPSLSLSLSLSPSAWASRSFR